MFDRNNPPSKPIVAHSVELWLGLTMSWIYNQLKYMRAFQPFVITQTTQNVDLFPWSPIYCMPPNRYSRLIFRILRKLRIRSYPPIYDAAIGEQGPSILHSHFGDLGWQDLPVAKTHALKHVVTFYGYDVNMMTTRDSVWKERYLELFEQADLFLCEGPHMANCLVKLGCPANKLRVIRLGIEVDKIPFVPRKVGADKHLRILIAGTFREKKGIPFALEAIALVRQEHPSLSVTIIGDSTGEERAEREKARILKIVERHNLGPVIRLLGYQPHPVFISELYQHHIFLSPSVTGSDGDTEGGAPVSIIEALASGIVVVSTFHCDIPNIIANGRSGYLVPERDALALAEVICKLLREPEIWSDIQTAGRKSIEENHDIRIQVHHLEDCYRYVSRV